MHQTPSSALRAQVKKRPARTSIQPRGRIGAHHVRQAIDEVGAPI
jgi:hypothetical protein